MIEQQIKVRKYIVKVDVSFHIFCNIVCWFVKEVPDQKPMLFCGDRGVEKFVNPGSSQQ